MSDANDNETGNLIEILSELQHFCEDLYGGKWSKTEQERLSYVEEDNTTKLSDKKETFVRANVFTGAMKCFEFSGKWAMMSFQKNFMYVYLQTWGTYLLRNRVVLLSVTN